MWVTTSRILKTQWAKWLKIYNASMEVHDEHLPSLLQIYTPYYLIQLLCVGIDY
jgi:hypothetical protein